MTKIREREREKDGDFIAKPNVGESNEKLSRTVRNFSCSYLVIFLEVKHKSLRGIISVEHTRNALIAENINHTIHIIL